MTYSVEKLTDGKRSNRWGFFDTIEAAKQSAGTLYAEGGSAAVWESESTSAGDGVLVSVFDRERGWIDVGQVAQPAWWDSVSTEVRVWLTANPGAPLPSWVWVPVVQAGGLVYSIQWEGSDPSGMSLTLANDEWVRFQRAAG